MVANAEYARRATRAGHTVGRMQQPRNGGAPTPCAHNMRDGTLGQAKRPQDKYLALYWLENWPIVCARSHQLLNI